MLQPGNKPATWTMLGEEANLRAQRKKTNVQYELQVLMRE